MQAADEVMIIVAMFHTTPYFFPQPMNGAASLFYWCGLKPRMSGMHFAMLILRIKSTEMQFTMATWHLSKDIL